LQQLGPALRELREAWKVAPHAQRTLAVTTMLVTLLGIAIGLSFVPWWRLWVGFDTLVTGFLRQR
jgi:hypothetical protein